MARARQHRAPLSVGWIGRQCKVATRTPRLVVRCSSVEWPYRVERQIEPGADLLAHRTGNAHCTRRALGLKSHRDVDGVSMQVSPVGDRVADVDSDAEADGAVRRLRAVVV